jgi:hypothetical protein
MRSKASISTHILDRFSACLDLMVNQLAYLGDALTNNRIKEVASRQR